MSKLTNEQLKAHDEAFSLMDKKGMTLSEKMRVRSSIVEWSGYKNEYPFISSRAIDEDGEEIVYSSTYDLIKSFCFKTENEVILANAIYLNMNEIHGDREFIEMFKYTCRVIVLNSEWA